MLLPRVIPVLLLSGKGLVKGINFKNHVYVGDPINAVQIFNTKEVDELLFLDITATSENRIPSPELIQSIANQCLMPFGVGGGIKTLEQARSILSAGAEKVCINTGAMERPELIREIAEVYGNQSVVVSIDVKRNKKGVYEAYSRCGSKKISDDPMQVAKLMEEMNAGEILLNSIDRDGTMEGYDIAILKKVQQTISIPLIACGGAWTNDHLKEAIEVGHASAVAAGSKFVFHGKRRAVLINYPNKEELQLIRGG